MTIIRQRAGEPNSQRAVRAGHLGLLLLGGANPQLCGAEPYGWEGSGQRCALWSCVEPVPGGSRPLCRGRRVKSHRAWGSCGLRGISQEAPSSGLEPGLTPRVLRSTMCASLGLISLLPCSRNPKFGASSRPPSHSGPQADAPGPQTGGCG